jgi:hypothetical protein
MDRFTAQTRIVSKALIAVGAACLVVCGVVTFGELLHAHNTNWSYPINYVWISFYLLLGAAGILVGWKLDRDYREAPLGVCPKCGYDLTGNVSGVCPECGCTLEPNPAQ